MSPQTRDGRAATTRLLCCCLITITGHATRAAPARAGLPLVALTNEDRDSDGRRAGASRRRRKAAAKLPALTG